jgi:hypothetical protein
MSLGDAEDLTKEFLMGFDLYIKQPPRKIATEIEEATDAYEAALDAHARGGAFSSEAAERYMAALRPTYFRVGWFEMSSILNLMSAAGMLARTTAPPFPTPEQHGITPRDIDATRAGNTPPCVESFREAYLDALKWAPPSAQGICTHKLSDNTGWLVTPLEITTALEALRRPVRPGYPGLDLTEYPRWDEWIEYLSTAAQQGGFNVH